MAGDTAQTPAGMMLDPPRCASMPPDARRPARRLPGECGAVGDGR